VSDIDKRVKIRETDKKCGVVWDAKYVHPLTAEAVEALRQVHRRTRQASVRCRCEMILLSHEGLSPPQIAQRVRLSDRTVRRVIERYDADGLAGLNNKPIPGRPPRVTAAYLQQLEGAVERPPRALGLPFSNWTTANLATIWHSKPGLRSALVRWRTT
jgi:transposase